MAALPGWNSLESVSRFHSWLEIAGIVSLAALVFFEILAFAYNQRKDILVAAAEHAAAAEARERTAQLERTLDTERAARLPRTLTAEQQARLVEILTPAPKGIVFVIPGFFDGTDAKPFAASVSDVLRRSGFTVSEPTGTVKEVIGYDRAGAWLWVNDIGHTPPHARPIQDAFKSIGISLDGISKPETVDPKSVLIAIGSHP